MVFIRVRIHHVRRYLIFPTRLWFSFRIPLIKKFNGSSDAEKAWSGKVHDIQKIPGSIFFRVEIEQEIACPEKYADYENGWYVEN